MSLNPENQNKLNQSKFSSLSKFIAFQTYSKEKKERQNIEQQRKNIELHVANLYRQARLASKELNKTQIAVIQNMNRKSSKEKYDKQKQQYLKVKQEKLNQLKNNNSLARYMNMLKREEAKRRLADQNKQMSSYIKQRENHDNKMKKIRQMQQKKLLFEKNTTLDKNIKSGIQFARTKNLYQKKSISSIVRNDLLQLQNIKIERQKASIQELSQKQKQLSKLFHKTQIEKKKYQQILSLGKNKSFLEMYQVVAEKQGQGIQKAKRRKRSHKKKKSLSEAKIIQSYLGFDNDF